MNFLNDWLTSIIGGEFNFDFTGLIDNVVLASVLISISMSSNDDWLNPSGNKSGNVADDNGLSENSSVQDIPDGTVGRSPHLLKVEFLNSSLIGSDGGALDSYLGSLDGLSSIDSDLIIGSISVLDTEIKVFGVEVEVGVDVLFLDPSPDDSGHLISIKIANWLGNLELGGKTSSGV